MEREERINGVIKAINELLDVPIQTFHNSIVLDFSFNKIYIALFDDRLPAGLNSSEIYVALPFEDDELFAKFEIKKVSVNNQIIAMVYPYSNDPTELITPQFKQAIESCRKDVPFLVRKFFEQLDKNNKYINTSQNHLFDTIM